MLPCLSDRSNQGPRVGQSAAAGQDNRRFNMRDYPDVKRLSLVLAGLAGVACLCAVAAGDDWPIYRGAAHDGISAEKGWFAPGAQLKVLWSADIGRSCSAMAVVGDRVYTMGNKADNDIVYCFEAASGKELWKYSYPEKLDSEDYEGGPNATPTVDGKCVYTVSKTGKVFCLDAEKGTKVWEIQLASKKPTWGYAGSVLPLGDKLIVNAGDHGTCLDKATGKVVWDSGAGPGGYSTPVPYERGGKTLIALFSAKNVLAVNAADGKVVWSLPWQTSYDVNAADPVILDGGAKAFISSGYGHGCAMLDVSGEKPTELWSNKTMRNKHTNSVVYQGAIYGFDEKKILVCLDAATGQTKWTKDGFGLGSLMVADGKLIILSDKGELVIAEASGEGFKQLAAGQVLRGPCWTVPVLANGRICARSKTGTLSCSTFGK
jgi:outer membrane protein assembly factor BamB